MKSFLHFNFSLSPTISLELLRLQRLSIFDSCAPRTRSLTYRPTRQLELFHYFLSTFGLCHFCSTCHILHVQKCRKIQGLGCVNRAYARARVTQPSPRIFLHICTGRIVLSKSPFQIQSDDEDMDEFEYEDFPEMPEFLRRASSPYSASQQQQHDDGHGYKPLGRKRYRESVCLLT